MPKTVYVTHSHEWLHSKLFEHAPEVPEGVRYVPSRDEADLIIYLDPPWPDDEAPDTLRSFSRRELLRTFAFSQSDRPTPWVPGMYASLRRRHGPTARAFTGGFYVIHHLTEPGGLRDHLEAARGLPTDLLWSFVGTAQNAVARRRVLRLSDTRSVAEDTHRFSDTLRWGWSSTYRDEAQEAFRRYATVSARSKFVLCPRGRGLSSIRIFEALELGRCPVIIADGWSPPPFVDWDRCSIRIPEKAIHRIPHILRERERDAVELGRNAREVWERFFSPETQLATLVRACVEISEHTGTGTRLLVPLGRLAHHGTYGRLASRMRTLARRAI